MGPIIGPVLGARYIAMPQQELSEKSRKYKDGIHEMVRWEVYAFRLSEL